MAHKNIYGKIILSAGEIGSYTTCPEAWRLEVVERIRPQLTPQVQQGEDMHKEWASDFDQAIYFTRSIRLIIFLIIISVLFFVIRHLTAI